VTEAAAEVKTILTDTRDGVGNAFNWLKDVVENHLPAVERDYNAAVAELKRLQADEIVKAAEDALLTPAERSFVARFISEIPSLRVRTGADENGPVGIDAEPDSGQQAA
jgi:hypothetical protein